MEEGLRYSNISLLNRPMFYSNDIIIFVEDEKKEYNYEDIFERMFKTEKISIKKIFSAKGKLGVTKAFEKFNCNYNGTPTFYLVDGDFDLVLKKEIIESPNYIYLEKYNIESYYIDENAILKYMAIKLKQTKKNISSRIRYSNWKDDVYNCMKNLFINYMVAQSKLPSEKNVGLSAHRYFQDDGYPNQQQINEYIDGLKNKINDYEYQYNICQNCFETILLGDATRLVCGKYMLASLYKYLRYISKNDFKKSDSFKIEDLTNYLAVFFDIKELDFVKNKILSMLKA